MIFRWLISSSLALGLASAAVLAGKVELKDSREKSVERGHDYSGVVVWLELVNGGVVEPAAPPRATMIQKNKKVLPHVLAVRRGTNIDFPNQDPIFHNAFSNFSGQVFDIGLYKPGSSRTVRFGRPGVVRVFCNIHAAMSAVIVVVDSPWFTTTAADGSFQIADVPPGEYRLRAFHERASVPELTKVERTLTVPGTRAVRLSISESGFLPVPHLNKHGKEYPSSEDSYQVVK